MPAVRRDLPTREQSGYGCATHKDGGGAACTNGVRVRGEPAERKLLDELACEMLSPDGVAMLERRVREHVRKAARAPKAPPKSQEAQIAKKRAEIEQLRALMKAGTRKPYLIARVA